MVGIEGSVQKRLEELIAISLYQVRANRVKESIRDIYRDYEKYLKPLEEVREILAREVRGRTLSEEIIELRRREVH